MSGLVDVSVVIPCYSCAQTIERAVKSVADQTQKPLELILVNDASPDAETVHCLERLRDRYPQWVRVVSLGVNGGAGHARNEGWSLAKGGFIAFLDADDSWHPRKLEIQLAFMQAHPDIALSGHGHVIGAESAFINEFHEKIISIGKWAVLISNPFVTPSVMLRSDVSHRFRQDRRHMEDHLLWMDIVCDKLHVVKLDLPLVTVHKPLVGVGGLSAQVWAMSRADWGNYGQLFRSKKLAFHELIFFWIWVSLKFARRLLLLNARRFAKNLLMYLR